MSFRSHSDKQEQAIFSDKRIVLCSTGVQWGKTRCGAIRTKIALHKHYGPDCNHLVVAPTYKIMQQATLPAFLKVMEGCGTYHKVDAIFKCYSGATVFFRTATDPDSVVGLTNVFSIWADECGLYSFYMWVNILGRSRLKQCPITLTTSLYSYNWVCKELIRGVEKGERPDVHLCQAESRENPYFPESEYEAAKKTMSPARFAMMYGGRPSKMEGMVYDVFDEALHVVKPFELPSGTKFYAGIDWGYTQPFACTVVARLPSDHFMVVAELVQTRMTIDDIIEALKRQRKIWDIQRYYAGPDQPGSIEALQRAGLPCVAADNDVKLGVDVVYSLMREARLRFFEGQCPNLLDEIENYHWPEMQDLKPDQNEKDVNPVKQDDHSCLSGDSLVITPTGERQIKDIVVGDLVLTPLGFRKVLAAGKTGERQTIRLTTPDGRTITATADHPFYVPFKGFVRLDTVRYCDMFLQWKKTRILPTLIIKSTIGTANIIAQLVAWLKAGTGFMLRCGNTTMGLFQKATTSTTETITNAITIFQTWLLSIGLNTCPTTPLIELQNKSNATKFIWRILDHKPRPGTLAQKVWNGTVKTVSRVGLKRSLFLKYVMSVASNLRLKPTTADFARTIVSRSLDVTVALTISLSHVLSAVKTLLRINTAAQKPVLGNALVYQSQEQSVYNLKVDVGCYFANGFLVSNCDSLRYALISTAKTRLDKTKPVVSNQTKTPLHELSVEQRLKKLKAKKKAASESW